MMVAPRWYVLLLVPLAESISVNGVPLGGVAPRQQTQTQNLRLSLEGVGNLTVGGDEEPATAIERFAAKATAAGHRMNVETMVGMMEWYCARRPCGRPLTGPVSVNVSGVGRVVVGPYEEPAFAVERFAARATEAGVAFNVETMEAMLAKLCASRTCFRGLAGALTLRVTDVGNVTCAPYEEPADRVEYFAGLVADAGLEPLGVGTMQKMLAWFCERRSCFRPLTGPWTLSVTGLGNVTVRPNTEPAALVERFAAQATEAGAVVSPEAMRDMMAWFCERRSCHRPVAAPLRLSVAGVGNLTVMPNEEPATKVEAFAALAADAGIPLTTEAMVEILAYFCDRRACHRRLSPPLALAVEGLGNLTVMPHEDVADRVVLFAAAAARAGAPVDMALLGNMMDWFCARRTCAKPIGPPLKYTLEGLGDLTLMPWMDPTDSVEAFAAAANDAGSPLDGDQMVAMLTWFCERTKCTRLQLRPPPQQPPPQQAQAQLPAPPAA